MKRVTVFLAITLLIVSCNSNQTKSKKENSIEIALDNGEKWMVNDEMKPFIEQADKTLNNYISLNGTDYKTLAEKLKVQNNSLIKSCTMKGKGHDELHNWLLPHIELINNLEKSNDTEQSKLIITELKTSFDNYKNYFR